MIKYMLSAVLLALVFSFGCGSFPSTTGMSRDQIIQLADQSFQRGRWAEASFLYTELMFRFPGDSQTDFFLYRCGLCDREQKLWADAEFNFYRVVNEYSRGAWADDAQYALAETMWMERRDYRRDQTEVTRAREELQRFLDRYPASPLVSQADSLLLEVNDQLARKALYIGRFYIRRGLEDAALLYLRDAMDNYGETSYSGAVLLAMGDLYRKMGNNYSAKVYYTRALESNALTAEEEQAAQEGLLEVQ